MRAQKTAQILGLSLAASALVAALMPARVGAKSIVDEIRGGVLIQGQGGWSPDKEDGVSLNAELIFRSPNFLKYVGSPRPVVGASIATDEDATSHIYVAAEWKFDLTDRFFIAAHGGGAIHDGETDPFVFENDQDRIFTDNFFGCRTLFRIGGDIGYRLTERSSVSVHWQHISNANLCADNEGLDNIGLRYGYKF